MMIKKIDSLPLERVTGQDINDRFDVINSNFDTIKESEFLKGDDGINYNIKVCKFALNSYNDTGIYYWNGTEYEVLTELIIYGKIIRCLGINDGRFEPKDNTVYFITQEIDGKPVAVSSLPYVWLDGYFIDHCDDIKGLVDTSCTLIWRNDEFNSIKNFPTLYYNNADLCWCINGVKTDWVAKGPKGDNGEPGKLFVVKSNQVLQNICTIQDVLINDVWRSAENLSSGAGCIALISTSSGNTTTITPYSSVIFSGVENGVNKWYCYIGEDNRLNIHASSLNLVEAMSRNSYGLFVKNPNGNNGHALTYVSSGAIGSEYKGGDLLISAVDSLNGINRNTSGVYFDYDTIGLGKYIKIQHDRSINDWSTIFNSYATFNKPAIFNSTATFKEPISFDVDTAFNNPTIFNSTSTFKEPISFDADATFNQSVELNSLDNYSDCDFPILLGTQYCKETDGVYTNVDLPNGSTTSISTKLVFGKSGGGFSGGYKKFATYNPNKKLTTFNSSTEFNSKATFNSDLFIVVGEKKYKLDVDKLIELGALTEVQ